MDYESVGFTSVPTYQDCTAISAFAFDRRIRSFQLLQFDGRLLSPFNALGMTGRPPSRQAIYRGRSRSFRRRSF